MRIPRSAIALFCTALQICFGTVYAWSFFQTILVRQIGWTHTETAWAFSIAIFTLGVSAAWAGNMLPKMGPRKLALIGSFMFACGYLVSGLALQLDSIPLFYLGYGVIGGAGIGLGYVTPVATVAKWFPDRKGLATGIVVMGFGVGAFLLSKGLAPFLIVRTAGALPEVFIWLGIIFALILIPCSLALSDPPPDATGPSTTATADPDEADEPKYARSYLGTTQFVFMWIVFFFNIAAGISVVSFQSEILQEIWGLADDSIEPTTLAEYGATLIAVSSICNGLGRLFWGLLSDRFGRVTVFRVLLGSQMVVFGILMTETNPWVFSALGLLRAALLRRRFRHHAFLRPRRVRHEEDVHHLRRGADRVGGRGDFRTAVRGVPQGRLSRPRGHVLLPHRDPHARRRLPVLLSAERRTDPPGPPDARDHPAAVRDRRAGARLSWVEVRDRANQTHHSI